MKLSNLVPIAFLAMFTATPAETRSPKVQNVVSIQDTVEYRNFSEVEVCTVSKLIVARIERPSISENRIGHEWHIIEWPSGNVRFTVDAGESLNTQGFFEPSFPQWSPDCRWLYYRALHDGEAEVWRIDATTGARERITNDEADILNFALAQNGKAIVYETGASRAAILAAEAREYQNGVLIDKTITSFDGLMKTQPYLGRWAPWRIWEVSEGSPIQGHLLSYEPARYRTISIKNRRTRIASEPEIAALTKTGPDWAPHSNSDAMLSPSGDQAAVVIGKKQAYYGGYYRDSLAAVQRENPSDIHECEDERCTATHVVPLKWAEDGTRLSFIAEHQRGAAGIYEWTPANGDVRMVLKTDGLLGALKSGFRFIDSQPCPLIDDTAFCTTAGPENPPRLMAISLISGAATTVIDPNAELRKRFALKAKRLSWKDRLDRVITGVLVYPRDFKKGERYPLVITTYTCRGFLHGGIADGGPEYVLADNGFLALCIDRNPEVEPFTEAHSRAEARYMGYLAEFKSAIEMLAEQGLADRSRVGVTGLSMGSQGSSYALTHSDIFQAAALRSIGVMEPAHEMRLRPDMGATEFIFKDHGLIGSEQEKKAVYERLSVTLRADRVSAPVLVQASDTEYSWSLSGFAALQKLGKPIDMMVFPDETHQLHQPIHRYVNFGRNLDWFRFWLQGYEDPDPEKADQYTRWRMMRDERCAWDEPVDKKPTYCEYASSQETVH